VLEPKAEIELAGIVSFQRHTTRTPFPGRHRIDVLVNGTAHPLVEFDVGAG